MKNQVFSKTKYKTKTTMTQMARPIVGRDDTKQDNPRPFSQMHQQTSRGLRMLAEAVKDPFLEIYSVGERCNCPHAKNFVRSEERILMTPVGSPINIDYCKEKAEQASKKWFSDTVSEQDRMVIVRAWNKAIANIKALEISLTPGEDALHSVFIQFLALFAGGNNVEMFHREKWGYIESYNQFLKDFSSTSTLPVPGFLEKIRLN